MLDMIISQQIASKTSEICGYSVSIIDSTGRIIGSGDKSRINTIHGGIEPVFKERKVIEHDENEVKSVPGAYEGVACPIIFNEDVIGAIGIRGNPIEVKKYMQLIKNQVEMMYQQRMYFQISQMKAEAFDLFMLELLSQDNEKNTDHIISLSKINNINLQIPRFAIVIEIDETSFINAETGSHDEDLFLNTMSNLKNSIESFFEEKQNILTKIGSNHLLLFKVLTTSLEKNLREIEDLHHFLLKKHGISTIIGIGKHSNHFLDFKKSYLEARQAVIIAQKMGKKSGVFYIEELYTGRILSEVGNEIRESLLSDSVISKLLLPENDILQETIYSFCNNDLNVSKTSRELCIHRNTLLYRLERIHKLTGLNPNSFNNAMTLLLLLRLSTFN